MSDEVNWRDGLSDDLKGNESLSSFENVEALAKSYIETKSMVGNALRPPSEDASDEDRAAFTQKVLEKVPGLMIKPDFENAEQSEEFYRALGVPESADKYDKVEFDAYEFPEEREEFFNNLAHSANLTQAQMKAMKEGMLKADHEALTSREESSMEAMKALKQEWGMAFDDRKSVAEKVRDTFFDFIPEGEMDAQTIKALHAVGKQLGGEGNDLGGLRDEEQGGKMTPADAQAQINDIMNNKEHAYWHSHHPEHQAALNHMVELRKSADPDALTHLPRAGFGS